MDALKYLHNVFFSNVSVFSVGQIYIVHEDIDCSRMSYKRSIFKAKLVCKFDSSVGELTLETVVCDEASWKSDHSCGLPHRHYQLNWRRWKQSKMQFCSGRGGGGQAWPLPTVGIRLPIKKLKLEKSANGLSSSTPTLQSLLWGDIWNCTVEKSAGHWPLVKPVHFQQFGSCKQAVSLPITISPWFSLLITPWHSRDPCKQENRQTDRLPITLTPTPS